MHERRRGCLCGSCAETEEGPIWNVGVDQLLCQLVYSQACHTIIEHVGCSQVTSPRLALLERLLDFPLVWGPILCQMIRRSVRNSLCVC
jgi:hypothetical protein